MAEHVRHVYAASLWRPEHVICPHCGMPNEDPGRDYPDRDTLLTFPICPRCRKEYVIERKVQVTYRAYPPKNTDAIT